MQFDEDLCRYTFDYDNLIFVWDEEPEGDWQDMIEKLACNYYKHLNSIIEFMMSDLVEIYGNISIEDIKKQLGKPLIDYDNGQVTYLEQTFDNEHIFSFEFLDDKFEDLQYFSIDG